MRILILLLLLLSPIHASADVERTFVEGIFVGDPTFYINPRIVVTDALGRQVGTVVGASVDSAIVALLVPPYGVLLHVVAGTSYDTQGGTVQPIQGTGKNLMFESDDCSGTPFLFASKGALIPTAVVSGPNMTLYVPARLRPAAQVAPRSFINILGLCESGSVPTPGTLVPAAPVVDLLTLFTPPFGVQFIPQ